MPKASFQQANFLGGEWSPLFQGRVDNPRYKTAMNLSSNGYPIEEGAWVKRSGFRWAGETYLGNPARMFPFSVNEDTPFEVELSAGVLRVWAGDELVQDSTATLVSISTGSPCQIVVGSGGAGWTTGNTIVLTPGMGVAPYAFGSLPNQQLLITGTYPNFTLTDPATGANIDGSQIILPDSSATLGRIFAVSTPYGGTDWYDVKTTMVNNTMFLFHKAHLPNLLMMTSTVPSGITTTFSFGQPQFNDGPYFPPVGNASLGTSQTFDWTDTQPLVATNLTNGFGPNQTGPTLNDVGRSIRILSEPQPWVDSTRYPQGATVTLESVDGNQYYSATAEAPAAGYNPNLNPQYWALNPELVQWAWGTIESVQSATAFKVTLVTNMAYDIPNPILTFQLGIFGDPVYGYPSSGCFHEGRLWVFGENYILGSSTVDNTGLTWSPTLVDETVTDASAINYQLEAGDDNSSSLLWGISNQQGMLLGTNGGEWLVQASALNDPITPTSVQAHRVTKYRCSYVKPVQCPLAIVFVQRFQRKVMEYLPDVFTGRYVAPNLTIAAKHLTTNGVEEVVYQEELTPIIWLRDLSGNLRGITYRRQSSFPSEEPVFTGWHRHIHGEGRIFASLCMSPSGGTDDTNSLVDYLYSVTSDANSTNGTFRVERMVKMFDIDDTEGSAFFVDGGIVPVAMLGDLLTGVTIYGLYAHAGQSVTAVLGGVDMGVFTVSANGSIFVPYNTVMTGPTLIAMSGGEFGETAAPLTIETATLSAASAWSSGTAYPIGALVTYMGATYASLNCFNTGNTPTTDFWAEVTVPTSIALWNATTTYAPYSLVTWQGAVYFSLAANSNEVPSSPFACDWAQVSGVTATTSSTTYSVPCVVGFDYSDTTQGQILRPGTPQDAGAANGPPQGKTRRLAEFAMLFQTSQAVEVGTDFSHLYPLSFTSPGGTPYPVTELFSGVYWDTIDDDYSFDGMICWQSTGPYPLTVVSTSGFIETMDR